MSPGAGGVGLVYTAGYSYSTAIGGRG